MTTNSNDEKKLWNDVLHGKHECFSVSRIETRDCMIGDEHVQIRISSYLPKFQVAIGAVRGPYLFLCGQSDEEFADKFCGAVLVGRRADDGIYDVHVWHELYPWACKELGIVDE